MQHSVVVVLFAIAIAHAGNVLAAPKVSYFPRVDIKSSPPKDNPEKVEIILGDEKSYRPATFFGEIRIVGDVDDDPQMIFNLARAKAAEMGADIMKIIKMDERTSKVVSPSFGIALPYVATAMGPNISEVQRPILQAAIGVLNKSTIAIRWDEALTKQKRFVIEGFRSKSKAQQAGLKVGDEALEINQMDIRDPRAHRAFLEIEVGQMVDLFIKRNGETQVVKVETVENR